jgi:ABC-2 type transport system permease protein
MLGKIARFELGFQVRNPVFAVAAGMLFLFAFGSMASDDIQLGSMGNVRANSPVAIARTMLFFTLLYMFVTTAFVANVVVRDDETGFGPILRSTRITKLDYILGRFAGAFPAAALAFLAVPLALWLGSLAPWLDPETLVANRLSHYAFGYLVLALPNIFLTSAVFFALATITRSMMATYLGVVGFLILYLAMVAFAAARPEIRDTFALIEPFGTTAFSTATRYWTAAESNTMMPPLEGVLLLNRLIWISVGLAFLAIAFSSYSFSSREGLKPKKGGKRAANFKEAAPELAPSAKVALPSARFDAATARAQLWTRTKFEMKQVFKSPAFLVLLVIGLVNVVGFLILGTGKVFGADTIAVTRAVVPLLQGTFTLFPMIIAIYYAGELVWRERDRKFHEILDASPIPNWAYVVPKAAAVTLVLLATMIVGAAAAMLIQFLQGIPDLELEKHLLWYILPSTIDVTLIAVLAVFLQALSPNKYVGWGLMVIFIVSQMVASSLGFEHNLYQYGGTPTVQYSDMNGAGHYWQGAWWFRLYWIAFGILLLVAAHLLWRRGTETRLMPRIRRVPGRLKGAAGIIGGTALVAFVGTGAWAFYNTNVLNEYQTSDASDRHLAEYEKKFIAFEKVPQPAIKAVKLKVDIFPEDGRAVTTGGFLLENKGTVPVAEVHVRDFDDHMELTQVAVEGAQRASHDARYGYSIYRFAQPMAPGETRSMTFATSRSRAGFKNSRADTKLVENGTFLNNFELAPMIGMSRQGLLNDPAKRRKFGLAPELRPAKLEDLGATAKSYFPTGWTTADITVSTSADQTPIAPGMKVSDTLSQGRRVARFVSDAPIQPFFSIQSGRYLEKHRNHKGVDLAVYYHPAHERNVDRMLNALAVGLDYYQANFGPYQFDQARIIEFPAYATFAQAFANTMPYSEAIGFVLDSKADGVDAVTYVTAHELGHQYWGHQVVAAEMQGSSLLSETLAQYSALMVMKKIYGEDMMRRFLRLELDTYLAARRSEANEELPLARVEGQQYIHYNKGSLAMYLLQHRLGEAAVNRALSRFITRFKFKGAPYPRSVDLIKELRQEAKTPEQQALITDLFERITLYDMRVDQPTALKRADGKWDVTVPVVARKAYADGKGEEKETGFNEQIEIGIFSAEPGRPGFTAKNVLHMGPQAVKGGKQVFRFVTSARPTHAGVDPYNLYVDRNSTDNVGAIK